MATFSPTPTQILSSHNIQAKLLRMAYEICERNYENKRVVLVAIGEGSQHIAQILQNHLQKISPLQTLLQQVQLDRSVSTGKMPVDLPNTENQVLQGDIFIVVDDVLYSGRTLLSVVAALLTYQPSSIQTCVLIDRGHREMPISPDYVGMVLATTLQQHVSVQYSPEGKLAAYLC